MSQVEPVFGALMSLVEGGQESDVLVVCVSYKPDKRKKEFKWFVKHTEVKEFKPLKGVGLKKWVRSLLLPSDSLAGEERADVVSTLDLEDEVLEHMLLLTGNDLWYVRQSLDLLAVWHEATGEQITVSIVDELIYSRTEANNFAFLDALFVDRDKALRRLDDAKDSGVHWTLFLGAVYW